MAHGVPLTDPIPLGRFPSEGDRLDTGLAMVIAVLILTVKQITKCCQQTRVGQCPRTARPPVTHLPTADRPHGDIDGLGHIPLTKLGAQAEFESLAGFGPKT